jgi:hypothetical protein
MKNKNECMYEKKLKMIKLNRLKLDMEEATLIYTQFKDNIEAQEIMEPLAGWRVTEWRAFEEQCAKDLETEESKKSIKKTGEELENLYTTVTQQLSNITIHPPPESKQTGYPNPIDNTLKFTPDLKDVKTVVPLGFSKEILTPEEGRGA